MWNNNHKMKCEICGNSGGWVGELFGGFSGFPGLSAAPRLLFGATQLSAIEL